MKRSKPRILKTLKSRKEYRTVYLKSKHWRELRAGKLKKNPVCQLCKSSIVVDVHHIFYGQLHDVRLDWTVSLCRKCHTVIHKKRLLLDKHPDLRWFSGGGWRNRKKFPSLEKMFLNRIKIILSKPKKLQPSPDSNLLLEKMDGLPPNGRKKIYGIFKCQPVSSFSTSHFKSLLMTAKQLTEVLNILHLYRNKNISGHAVKRK